MEKKMKNCQVCGAEIASNAKICPKCGAKNKRPIYKKWWFYVIIALLVFACIGGGSTPAPSAEPAVSKSGAASSAPEKQKAPEEPPKQEEVPVSYAHYPVTELFDALSNNALKAQRDFKGQYVELEGFLSTIDSDGSYISVGANPDDWDYLFQSVQCYIKDEDQLDQIINMNSGDEIVVRGKIKDVGEVLGYRLDIDSIN